VRKRYPIRAKLRKGNVLLLRNELEAQSYGGLANGFEYDPINDIVSLTNLQYKSSIKKVKIHGGIRNGDISSIFVEDAYQPLPVNGKTVIDIGANIADSCIYFALRGAHKVFGLEPLPKNYELGVKNINCNNLSDKIILLLAGCAGDNREIMVDPLYEGGLGNVQKDFGYGVKVPLLTIEKILHDNNLDLDNSTILKIDCEGCEYETILSANDHTIQKFSHIIIEYHYGYKNLKQKLVKCGFKVSVTRPHIHKWNSLKLQSGFLLAEKN
jgi:FkbM family methyltransferase